MKEGKMKKLSQDTEYAGGYVSEDSLNEKELPTKFGMWSKVKSFLFKEINLSKKVAIEVTPKEEKVLTDVHDFLFQEISFSGLFSLGKNKKNNETKEQL